MIVCACPNPSIDSLLHCDGWQPGGVNRVRDEQRFPGGKGVHVALALAELGCEVQLVGIWGGPTGTWRTVRAARRALCGHHRRGLVAAVPHPAQR